MIGAVYPGQAAPGVLPRLGVTVVSGSLSVVGGGTVIVVATTGVNITRVLSGVLSVSGTGFGPNLSTNRGMTQHEARPQVDANFLRQFPIHRNNIRRT